MKFLKKIAKKKREDRERNGTLLRQLVDQEAIIKQNRGEDNVEKKRGGPRRTWLERGEDLDNHKKKTMVEMISLVIERK